MKLSVFFVTLVLVGLFAAPSQVSASSFTSVEIPDAPAVYEHANASAIYDSEGVLYSVWKDGRSGADARLYFAQSKDHGLNWSGSKQLSQSYAHSTSIDTCNKNLVVAWSSGNKISTKTSNDSGITWSDPKVFAMSPNFHDLPEVKYDKRNCEIHMIFTAKNPMSDTDVDIAYTQSNDGINWTRPHFVGISRYRDWASDLAIDSNGGVHIVYDEYFQSGHRDVYYQYKPAGGSFGTRVNVTANYEYFTHRPEIEIGFLKNDSVERIFLTWDRYNYATHEGTQEIVFSQKPIAFGTFSEPLVVSDPTENIGEETPKLSLTDGNLIISWLGNAGSMGIQTMRAAKSTDSVNWTRSNLQTDPNYVRITDAVRYKDNLVVFYYGIGSVFSLSGTF